jgi:hypothetical protein
VENLLGRYIIKIPRNPGSLAFNFQRRRPGYKVDYVHKHDRKFHREMAMCVPSSSRAPFGRARPPSALGHTEPEVQENLQ